MYLVLAYHRIGKFTSDLAGNDPLFTVSKDQFCEQLEAIDRLKIPVISQSELINRLQKSISAEQPTLVLGFDDGNDSDLDTVAPLLEGKYPAIFYITLNHLGDRIPISTPRELVEAGFEVGGHGWTHGYLTKFNEVELQREVKEAKKILEKHTGERVNHFAYPGGRWNAKTNLVVREAGFHSAVNTSPFIVRRDQNPYQIPRVSIRNTFDLETFEAIIRQDDDALLRLQKRANRVGILRRLAGDRGLDWIRKHIYT